MSNFMCEICGTTIIDTPKGYMTGCSHHPIDNSKDCTCHAGKICKKHTEEVIRNLSKCHQIDIPSDGKLYE